MICWFTSRRHLVDAVHVAERETADAWAEVRQMRLALAAAQERAETMRRMEEDSWRSAVQRGDQLRDRGFIPAGFPS